MRGTEFLGWRDVVGTILLLLRLRCPTDPQWEMSGRQLNPREDFWRQPGEIILEFISIDETR